MLSTSVSQMYRLNFSWNTNEIKLEEENVVGQMHLILLSQELKKKFLKNLHTP